MQNEQVLSAYCHPGASISSCVLIHLTARTSCASHQAIRSGRSVGRLSPLAPILSLSPQPRQCLHMAAAPLVVLSLLTSGEGLGCALYPGMLPALSINPALRPDGELMLQMWSVPCHYLTSPKGYSPRVMLLKGTACFACRGQVRLLLCACCKMLLFRKGLMLRGLAPWRCWQKAGGKEALF